MMSNTNGFHSSSLSDATKYGKNCRSKLKTRSMKGFDEKKKRLEHSDTNNNRNSTKKSKHHIPSNNYCHSCGEYYGEMITCNSCSATFHLICTNPPLTKEDKPKGCYLCEHCRMNKQEKLILPFSFDPKKNLQLNGLKKQSTLGQIKLPIASNGQSLIQPSGEIKFRATSKPVSNLKRKRMDSSSPPSPQPQSSTTITSPNTQLEALHRLFLSCRSEEFHGPSFPSKHRQKSCFICRKSSIKQGPSIQCDYCPLTYHLDCLTPPLKSFPLSHEKWMCPNHMTPSIDRYLSQKTINRVKIYHQNSPIEENIILQDFIHHPSQRIDISEIPKAIQEFYSQANNEQKSTNEIPSNEQSEETFSPYDESSSAYDPTIWDILQSILNDIVNNQSYEFSPIIENFNPKEPSMNTLNTLLQALNETKNDLEQNPIQSSFSHLIDLTQFRLSHAALIHLHSRNVIYLRKHVIWFGSSSFNDICLENLNLSHPCQRITERHACLYYDQKRNAFELLNYSEYGTIVNDIRYGISDDDDDENIDLQKCFCCTKVSTWDGPAQIEQGTVIKIGCHEFLFYRHIVR